MPKKKKTHINTAFLIPHSESVHTFHKCVCIYVQLLSDWFHWAQMMSTDGSIFIKKTFSQVLYNNKCYIAQRLSFFVAEDVVFVF